MCAGQAQEGSLAAFDGGSWGHQDELKAFGVLDEVCDVEDAVAFFGPAVTEGQQATEAPPGGAVARIGQNVGGAVAEDEAGSHQKAQAAFPGLDVGAHDACDRIAVCDADCREAESLRLFHAFVRVRGTAQEAVVRRHGEFGVSRCRVHENIPWTYH